MGKKLTGMVNLTRLPKDLIFENKRGEKCIFVDVVKNLNGPDQYGNTHALTVYDKNARKAIYLGNLKEQDFGAPANAAQAPAAPMASVDPGDGDLPF